MANQCKTRIVVVGKIEEIGEVKSFSNGKFKKQVITVVENKEKYANHYPLTLKNAEIQKADGWVIGDLIQAEGYVNGSRWQKKDADGKPIGKPMTFLEIDCDYFGAVKQVEEPTTENSLVVGEETCDLSDIPF